jgi:hypothetical protein
MMATSTPKMAARSNAKSKSATSAITEVPSPKTPATRSAVTTAALGVNNATTVTPTTTTAVRAPAQSKKAGTAQEETQPEGTPVELNAAMAFGPVLRFAMMETMLGGMDAQMTVFEWNQVGIVLEVIRLIRMFV